MGAADEIQERATRRVGRVLGERWRLERLLGVGGMASVYAATHTNNQRGAAIKLLHRELSVNESTRRRFLREGYIANKVAHPGAVSIVDDGVDEDGSVFLVLELLQGETLQARAQGQDYHMDPRALLRLAVDLLDVLAVAHTAQVIHRDLKPENIFLTSDGAVKVLDFGIARLNEPRGDLTTQMGAIVGTPTYMPPEQVAGRMEEIDARTDLWAVGAILFTCFSGRFVHEANQATALLYQAMTQPAPKLADIVPDVPPAFAAVVDRALAFDRDDRWPDARTMQSAVREALGSEGSALGPTDSRTSIDSPREVPFAETVALGPGQAKALATGPGVAPAVSVLSSSRIPIVTPAHGPSQTEFGVGVSQTSPSDAPPDARAPRTSRRSLTTALVAFLVGILGAMVVWRRRSLLDRQLFEAGLSEMLGGTGHAEEKASANVSSTSPTNPESPTPPVPDPPSGELGSMGPTDPRAESLASDLDAGDEDDDAGDEEDDDGGEEEDEEDDAGAPSSLVGSGGAVPVGASVGAASFGRTATAHKAAPAPGRKAAPAPAKPMPKKRKKKRRRKGPSRR